MRLDLLPILILGFLLAVGCDAKFVDLRPDMPDEDAGASDSGPDATGDGGEDDDVAGSEMTLLEGTFMGRTGHSGEGSAALVRLGNGTHEVRFGENFAVTNGPGLIVVLSSRSEIPSFDANMGDMSLGALEATSGAQSYDLADPGDRNHVFIYCSPFGIEFARAQLEVP